MTAVITATMHASAMYFALAGVAAPATPSAKIAAVAESAATTR